MKISGPKRCGKCRKWCDGCTSVNKYGECCCSQIVRHSANLRAMARQRLSTIREKQIRIDVLEAEASAFGEIEQELRDELRAYADVYPLPTALIPKHVAGEKNRICRKKLHPLVGSNLVVDPKTGAERCKICKKATAAAYRDRRRNR